MARTTQTKSVWRSLDVLDGRTGFRIEADWGHVAVLEGGGHICELNLKKCDGVNPLWKPQWKTIDPFRYTRKHVRAYGPPPDGKLLAGIAGHSLSFDHFGPPSKEETEAGLSTHGEAPSLKWRALAMKESRRPTLEYGQTLPEARIRFSRNISVDPRNAIVYCEEEATNLSSYDRPISWNEHVTFGPPFLECAVTIFDMPATHAKVCPATYSSRLFLQADAEFTWPMAPAEDGSTVDLRTTPNRRFGHYTAQLMNPELEIAFIAACNPRLGLLVVYAFRRPDFPWAGNWEERHNRSQAPWRRKTFCRGIEFSTTPFAIPRWETIDQGRLFGEATYRWLRAKSSAKVRFMIMLFATPEDFRGVAEVSIARGEAHVLEAGSRGRELIAPVGNFLS
jgi:hypothetical protein